MPTVKTFLLSVLIEVSQSLQCRWASPGADPLGSVGIRGGDHGMGHKDGSVVRSGSLEASFQSSHLGKIEAHPQTPDVAADHDLRLARFVGCRSLVVRLRNGWPAQLDSARPLELDHLHLWTSRAPSGGGFGESPPRVTGRRNPGQGKLGYTIQNRVNSGRISKAFAKARWRI